jgi:cystathionine beta-synthase
MMYKNLLDAIGNTPLVGVNFGTPPRIFAKLEYLNPGGSLKDRLALFMIEEAEQKGILKPGGILIEASSGNQGIATAMIGALKGYKVIITVFEKASQEKIQTLKAYGAEVIKCPATQFIDDPLSYYSQAIALHKQLPNSFMLNQYYSMSNPVAHYSSLGPEIWRQTQGAITHFFAAAGSGGTVSGVGKYLKEQNPEIKVIAIDSTHSFRATKGNPKPYQLEGVGIDFISPVLNYSVIDEFLCVTDQEALGMLKPMAAHHGLLIGLSSGAVAYAVSQYSKTMNKDALAVLIFGDSGRSYLTKGFYAEQSPEVQISPMIKTSQPTLTV